MELSRHGTVAGSHTVNLALRLQTQAGSLGTFTVPKSKMRESTQSLGGNMCR